jgi:hypothetical protein
LRHDDEAKRRLAFLAVVLRTWGHWPRAAVEEWSGAQFDLIKRGWRRSSEVADVSMSAWFLIAPPSWPVREARRLARVRLPGEKPEDAAEPATEHWPPLYRRRQGVNDAG